MIIEKVESELTEVQLRILNRMTHITKLQLSFPCHHNCEALVGGKNPLEERISELLHE